MNRLWALILVAVLLVILASAATLVLVTGTGIGGSRGDFQEYSKVPRRFNVFAGFTLCEEAIRESLNGKIISLESDDRAAKYDYRENMNQIFFKSVYLPKPGFLARSQSGEKTVFIRCDVSAETNEVEAVRVRPGGEEDFTEVHETR